MDRETREIYEARAAEWVTRRAPRHLDRARRFGADTKGPTVDLGCGPGWYAPVLAPPVIALDGARAMLDLTAAHAPNAFCVEGDLGSAPLRRHSVGAVWASHSLLHIPRAALPMALAQLHWAMRVDGRLLLRVGEGDREGRRYLEHDDFPGRFFALWPRAVLEDVVRGAGFVIEQSTLEEHANRERTIEIEAVCARTLPDIVAANMRVLVCGLNPSLYAADAGVGFARPGNRFWPAALRAGLVSRDRDPWHALRHHHVGFTDVVKRATVAASALESNEYRDGFARVERLVEWLQPGVVAFVGLAGWRAAVDRNAVAGPQNRTIGGRPSYVMPSSSGLNTHATVDSLVQHLQHALSLT